MLLSVDRYVLSTWICEYLHMCTLGMFPYPPCPSPRPALKHSIVHHVLLEYLSHAEEEDRAVGVCGVCVSMF